MKLNVDQHRAAISSKNSSQFIREFLYVTDDMLEVIQDFHEP